MIKTVLNVRQEVVYRDQELEVSYRRVAGGLAWPAPPEPGALVVVAEHWVKDEDLQARPLRVLAERYLPTIQTLRQGCLELRKLCCVGEWLTDMGFRTEASLFLRPSREEKLSKEVYLRAAPYTRQNPDLGIYLQLLGEVAQKGRKVLTFGAAEQLRAYYLARQAEELLQPAARFPPLAALGYALAEVLLKEPPDPRIDLQKPVTTWNRLQGVEGRR